MLRESMAIAQVNTPQGSHGLGILILLQGLMGNAIHEELYTPMDEVPLDVVNGNIAVGSFGIEVEDDRQRRYYVSTVLCAENSSVSEIDICTSDRLKEKKIALVCG